MFMFLLLGDEVSDSIVNDDYVIYNTMVMRYTEENGKWYIQRPELSGSERGKREPWRKGYK